MHSPDCCWCVLLFSILFSLTIRIALKKKKLASYEAGDLFASEELFGSKMSPSSKASRVTPTEGKKPVAPTQISTRKRLNPEDRLLRFNELRTFVADRIGLKPTATTPEQVRNSAWQHMFGLATTREQLESVTELFSKWRDSRRTFDDGTVQLFVRECLFPYLIYVVSSSFRPVRGASLPGPCIASFQQPLQVRIPAELHYCGSSVDALVTR